MGEREAHQRALHEFFMRSSCEERAPFPAEPKAPRRRRWRRAVRKRPPTRCRASEMLIIIFKLKC